MKRSHLISLLFYPIFFLNLAWSQTVVTSLNMDQCWVGPVEDSVLKIVNFGKRDAFQLDGFLFQSLWEKVEQKVAPYELLKNSSNLETLIHCSATSTSLVLNIKTQQSRFCVWAKMDHDQIEILTIGTEPKENTGQCSGAVLGELLITLVDSEKVNVFTEYLLEKRLIESAEQIRLVNSRLLAVSFGERSYFKEEELQAKIQTDLKGLDVIKFVELNQYPFQNGEFLTIEELGGDF